MKLIDEAQDETAKCGADRFTLTSFENQPIINCQSSRQTVTAFIASQPWSNLVWISSSKELLNFHRVKFFGKLEKSFAPPRTQTALTSPAAKMSDDDFMQDSDQEG